MMNAGAYQGWYDKLQTNQPIPNPIDNTLEGMKALLEDTEVDDRHKAAAAEFLKRTKYKNRASNLFAAFCSLGAAFSSMAYFLLIRDHSLDLDEWKFLIAPTLVGLFVFGATWYTYRHDTAEWMLDFSFKEFRAKERDWKDFGIYFLTFLVVAMEIALSGYGVTELNLGEAETSMVWLVCLAALVPEWAQTHKYLEKWIKGPHENKEFEGRQQKWLKFYEACSYITLAFWGMAIFPLLEENSNAWFASAAVIFYVFLGKPYMKEKAKDQVNDQFTSASTVAAGCYNYSYPISRIGNGIGDLAFSAYGFFEALKAFDLMKEDERPMDSFEFHGGECYKTWIIIVSAVIVVGASCVGSFLMSAGGDQKSYGTKIEEAEKLIQHPPPAASPATSNVVSFSMWHNVVDVPTPASIKKSNTP
ncbi:MAG: hypothetical protein ACHQAX_04725 [Gammaproteobacteria bacterium]